MVVPITVTFSAELSQKIQRLANLNEQDINEFVETLVDEALSDETEEVIDLTEPDEAVASEITAYHRLHKTLWEQYSGHYVAIHGGKLIDYDMDKLALSRRINERFPDQFVLLRKVEREPERVLYFRSPRIAENIR